MKEAIEKITKRLEQCDNYEALLGEIMATFKLVQNQKYLTLPLLEIVKQWDVRFERYKDETKD